jgi:hypothetical protein
MTMENPTDFLSEQWDVVEAVLLNSAWPELQLAPGWYLCAEPREAKASLVPPPNILLGPTSKMMAEHVRDVHNSCLAWDKTWDKVEELSKQPHFLDGDYHQTVEIRLSHPVSEKMLEALRNAEPGAVIVMDDSTPLPEKLITEDPLPEAEVEICD